MLLATGSPEQGALAYTLGADGGGDRHALPPRRRRRATLPPTATAGRLVVRARWTAGRCSSGPCGWSKSRRGRCSTPPGSSTEQIDCWLLHQANIRILDAAIEALGIDRERVVMHIDRYGNTSAGSVPIALDETLRAGGIRRGDQLLMAASAAASPGARSPGGGRRATSTRARRVMRTARFASASRIRRLQHPSRSLAGDAVSIT